MIKIEANKLLEQASHDCFYIYTDGSIYKNPGYPGGYSAVILNKDEVVVRECAGLCKEKTTNNRMELQGVILGLKNIDNPSNVVIFTDSQYVSKQFNKSKPPTKSNADLWNALFDYKKTHQIFIKWVRGHNGDPYNERADFLARSVLNNYLEENPDVKVKAKSDWDSYIKNNKRNKH